MQLDDALIGIAVEEAWARGEPVEPADLRARIDALAAGLWIPPGCAVHESIARLNLHLFDRHGLAPAGDDYGEPESCLLDHVLSARRGLPIVLSALYVEVGRRVGVALDGVGFPGHFLVAPRDAEPRFFIDPYHRGRVIDEARLDRRLCELGGGRVSPAARAHALRPVGVDYIRVRMDNNLKGAWLRRDDIDGAIRATRRLLSVAPHLEGEQRDLALMLVHQGRRDEAIAGLDAYLRAYPEAPAGRSLRRLLERLCAGLRDERVAERA